MPHMNPAAGFPVANWTAYGTGSPCVTENEARSMSIDMVKAVPELRWQFVQWHT
nr:hypothetical protein [uncultured Albidiferax sp.]